MKYQKATVTVINLGNEDILTCSGEIGFNNWPQSPNPTNNNNNQIACGWGGWWPWNIWGGKKTRWW